MYTTTISRFFFLSWVLLTATVVGHARPANRYQANAGITATTQNITVYLDAAGNATVSAAQVNNGSSSTCGTVTLGLLNAADVAIIKATASEYQLFTITAPAGASFISVDFASYGLPEIDAKGNYVLGSCNSVNSQSVVESFLLGQNATAFTVLNSTFGGDPCGGPVKRLYVSASYALRAPTAQLTFTSANLGTNAVVLVITDACGNSSIAQATITVADARCGSKNEKVSICHKGQTLCVSASAVPAHLAHGDAMGPCGNADVSARAIETSNEARPNELALETIPNPVSDGQFRVHVRAITTGPVLVSLFDMQGNLISQLFNDQMQLGEQRDIAVNRPELTEGLYLVRVQSGRKTSSLRVQLLK